MRPFLCAGWAGGDSCAGKRKTMKRLITKTIGLWLFAAALLAPFCGRGDNFLDDDLDYWYESGSDTQVQVYVDGLKNKSATSITIPKTVVCEYYIGNDEFEHVTYTVARIGSSAFSGCSSLKSVTIPNSVTSIGYSAFSGCSSLASVTIGNGVTSIGERAFSGCSSLTSVTIPNSVTSIDQRAFYNCSSLKSVTIPSSVTSIESYTFFGCSSLTSVTIPNSVTSIGALAFGNCSSLTEVHIPESVTDIDYAAFNLCEKLQRFVVAEDNPAYASPDGALCSKDLKTLVVYPRGRCDARLPDGLEEAMPDAFAGCNKLWMEWCKRINTIPYNLTNKVEDRAIVSLAVNADTALDAFVLKEGKVYDTVLRIVNTSGNTVTLTLPGGSSYETFKGASPLTLPAHSTSILTITRVAGGNAGGNVFLVTREELETVR